MPQFHFPVTMGSAPNFANATSKTKQPEAVCGINAGIKTSHNARSIILFKF